MYLFSKMSICLRKPILSLVSKPTPVTYIGAGKVKRVGHLLRLAGVKRALIVTDQFLFDTGLLAPMLEGIAAVQIETEVFTGVTPDPTFAVVDAAQAVSGGCDAVVAVGGGSVIDTAKAVAAAVSNNTNARRLAGMLRVKRAPLLCIAVPTTAGTGSETTVVAVVSDPQTHAKKQLLDPKLVPMIAVLDPELTVGLPPRGTAFTAFDALTHAVESYISTYATEETQRCARMAAKSVYENLPKVLENPADLSAREGLLEASFLAGMAFTKTYIGYVHAFAHTIGGKCGVAHGLANAVLLPHVMQDALPSCQRQFAQLAKAVGIAQDGQSEAALAEAFVKSVFALSAHANIPARLDAFPAEKIDETITMAFQECHGVYPVPRYYTRAQAQALLQKVCKLA